MGNGKAGNEGCVSGEETGTGPAAPEAWSSVTVEAPVEPASDAVGGFSFSPYETE